MRKTSLPGAAWSVLILAAVFLAFLPALSAGWVDFDDGQNFLDNPAWRGVDVQRLGWMATTTHMGPYQPLTWLSFGLEWHLWGLDARGYHFTNVLLHALAAAGMFHVAHRLLALAVGVDDARADLAAAFAALFFAVHPLRAESVAWITERRDVLSGALLVAALCAWLRYVQAPPGRRRRAYLASLALFALSMLAKATGAMAPLALLVLDVWPLRRFSRRAVVEKLPFLGVSLVLGVVAILGQAGQTEALVALEDHGPLQRAAQAAYAAVFYLRKTLLPLDLSPIYELPAGIDVLEPRFAGSLAALLLLAGAAWLARGRAPGLAAALAAYALLLAPVSGLLQAGPQLVADRYSYLPAIPVALLAGGVLLRLPARALAPAGALLVLLLGAAAWRQAAIWHGRESLWRHAVTAQPGSSMALLNLGSFHMEAGDLERDPARRAEQLERARVLLDRGLALSSQPRLYVARGVLERVRADHEPDPAKRPPLLREALRHIDRGLEAYDADRPAPFQYRFHRGTVLAGLGRLEEARAELEAYVGHKMNSVQGRRSLALVLQSLGRHAEAKEHLHYAVSLDPANAGLWILLARSLEQLGMDSEALGALQQAQSLREQQAGPLAREDPLWRQATREAERLMAPR